MADIKTAEERSRNMAAIKSKDTKPEIFVRHLLFHNGYRYRINDKKIEGHPDIWMSKYNTAIFINGCFWHRHGCKYTYMPKSRTDFWNDKFEANIARDRKVQETLKSQGIRCLIIWECSIKKYKKDPNLLLQMIRIFLIGSDLFGEI